MKKNRPVNLDLTTMVFPPMAIASILHRVTGGILFLLLPWALYLLDLSLRDASSFTELRLWLANPYCKVISWVGLSAVWYHILAGVRHMLMDMGWGEQVHMSRKSAILIVILGGLGALALGGWLW